MTVDSDLIEQLDEALAEAVRRVEQGKAAKASVSLSLEVGLDDDAHPEIGYTLKAGTAKKGTLNAAQGRLPFAETAAG